MRDYCEWISVRDGPRLPLEGSLDFTYRCNLACRHCWISLPANSPEKEKELTSEEILSIVNQARALGCRNWAISGGEPLLRADFLEIFDFLTRHSAAYSLNTNGTLITPPIARLMKRKGTKMVALYGATAEVHDRITRTCGSFEAALQGMAYLKEAGAGFIVQLVPMKDNFHQFREMIRLAESLSPLWRIGATWLVLSASGDPERNREILRQRLDPGKVVAWSQADGFSEPDPGGGVNSGRRYAKDARLFAPCIEARRDFHVDPYGRMSFCFLVQDPALRYDLKKGSFQEGWEVFIPSLAEKVRGGREYKENCGSCEYRDECLWCPVYGYLEHGRYSAKVEYLCSVAKEAGKVKKAWGKDHRRYYRIAGITIRVEADLPITESTFSPRFARFEAESPGEDLITLTHVFSLPGTGRRDLGAEIYRKAPWAVYRKGNSWIYAVISPDSEDTDVDSIAVFNPDYSRATIYHGPRHENLFRRGNLHSLTLFTTDQVWLARVLADRGGCYFHSAGVVLENRGLLFVGHSGAGKSTIASMLRGKGEILCDDRMIVRGGPGGFRIHGTWSHGDVAVVSADSAPLKAILFLEQAGQNLLIPIRDKRERFKRLLPYLIKPLETRDWWEKTLFLVERIAGNIPCFVFQFRRAGDPAEFLREL